MQINLFYVAAIIAILSIRSYALMIMDKRKAIKGKWRISEQRLLLSAFALGSLGVWLGMLPPVNHKKSKTSFILKLVGITLVQVVAAYYLNQYVENWYWEIPFVE